MKNLHRVVAAYEKMDERAREENLRRMESDAAKYPLKPQPKLRLILGNTRSNNSGR